MWGRGWRQTRDGVIPYKLFLLLLNALDTIETGEELLHARAAALGQALAYNGKDLKTRSQLRRLVRHAFPEVYD